MKFSVFESPFGGIIVAGDDRGLAFLDFRRGRNAPRPREDWTEEARLPLFRDVRKQVSEYFARRRETFDLPLAPRGTPFQKRVWEELTRVPYGTTVTYTELARRAGKPLAIRAAGAANGRNPISIVIPCHRVVGKNGNLTGYGGGLEVKRALLLLEGARVS
jgi:methylated-DNA-[protein]-cysteine S-methyltransferase